MVLQTGVGLADDMIRFGAGFEDDDRVNAFLGAVRHANHR